MENQIDEQEVIETPAPEQEEAPENPPQEEPDEQVTRLEKEKADLEAKNKQLYARLKKGTPKEEPVAQPQSTISEKDIFALIKADVSEEDIDEVKRYASYRGISISEAVKDKTLKSILSERQEERTSANAANTRSARGTSKVTGESLLEKARQGDVPDKDEDIDKIVAARMAAKLNK